MADVPADNPGTDGVVAEPQVVDAAPVVDAVEPAPVEPQAIPKPRFDEVIAERNALREERERLTQALMAMAQQREEAGRVAPAPAPEPAEPEFDEQTAKVVAAIERRIMSKVGVVQGDVASAKDMAEYATFHGQYVASGQVTPELATQIEGVMRAWKKAKVPGNRQDALWLIMGKELMEGKARAKKPAEDAALRHVTEAGGRSPAPSPRLPANLDRMSAAQQAEVLEKMLGDTEF